jgi:hypothetical protein
MDDRSGDTLGVKPGKETQVTGVIGVRSRPTDVVWIGKANGEPSGGLPYK